MALPPGQLQLPCVVSGTIVLCSDMHPAPQASHLLDHLIHKIVCMLGSCGFESVERPRHGCSAVTTVTTVTKIRIACETSAAKPCAHRSGYYGCRLSRMRVRAWFDSGEISPQSRIRLPTHAPMGERARQLADPELQLLRPADQSCPRPLLRLS
jgi:hypothetical protein